MKDEKMESKHYVRILLISLVGLWITVGIFYLHSLNKMMLFQQNTIGILYQRDEEYAKQYLYAMFEEVTETNIDNAQKAFQHYGFTDFGITYIGKNIGFEKSTLLWFGVWIFLGILIFSALYKEIKLQKRKADTLHQEILILKQNQMREDYIESQNKKVQSFIENIAHQMKTPLSRVYTSLDIVEDSLGDETAKQHVEECYYHLESINVLMKRLMDIGRLEAGKVIFQKERFYLDELFEEVKNSSTEGKSRVVIYCKKEKMEYYGDKKWLKEAFSNILCNAMEADMEGKPIEIQCSQNEDYMKISIRDHGPGLSEKDIPNIFDRFYLPENVKENHTGIGLNLAKLVIEGHMGSVYVYNHLEGGAIFQVILPVYDSLKFRR